MSEWKWYKEQRLRSPFFYCPVNLQFLRKKIQIEKKNQTTVKFLHPIHINFEVAVLKSSSLRRKKQLNTSSTLVFEAKVIQRINKP